MFPEGRFLEFLIVGIVALVVVGPKDLPPLLRRLGQFMAKVRGMAAEFRASFDEMARQSELDELRREVEAMRRGQIADIAAHAGHSEMQAAVDEIHGNLADVGVQLHPPMSYQYNEMQSVAAPAETPVAPPAPEAAKPARKPRAKAADTQPTAARKRASTPAAKGAAKPAPARRPRAKKTPEAGA